MPLKLGMLGMWHTHADGIVRQVAEHTDEFRLVGVYDADPAVVAARHPEWSLLLPGYRVFHRAEDLLRQDLDGVIVEGRVYENLTLAQMALDSGRPVLLEKPAGTDFDEFHRLIDLAQQRHLHVQLIYLFRYMSAIQELLQRARRGALGHIYEFRGRLPKDLPSYARYVDELSHYRGGIYFEMAGHLIDLAVALLGKPQEVHPCLAHHHTAEPREFVDHGIALLEFERAFGIVEVPALEVVPGTRRIEVYGTAGACIIPHLGSGHLANRNIQALEVYDATTADWETLELPAATLQIADLREFSAVVTGQKTPDFSHQHDLDVQEVLLRTSGMR